MIRKTKEKFFISQIFDESNRRTDVFFRAKVSRQKILSLFGKRIFHFFLLLQNRSFSVKNPFAFRQKDFSFFFGKTEVFWQNIVSLYGKRIFFGKTEIFRQKILSLFGKRIFRLFFFGKADIFRHRLA